MKMNIAIIGTGNIGSGLARTIARTKHGVVVASSNLDDAKTLARSLSEEAKLTVQATDVAQAVELAEVVILAVPFDAIVDIAKVADFKGKTVIDVTNPVFEDFSGLTIGHDTSAAEEIQKTLPHAKVVKAFNTVFAQIYERGLDFSGMKVPAFIASDDDTAKEMVSAIATDAGFDAVDAGPLSNARYIEPLAYLNIQFGYMLGRGTQIAPTWLSR
jgi:NADPH-dependent F420 reductase